MKAWVNVDDEGRVRASTTFEKYSLGMTEIEVDDDFDFTKQMDYLLKDGELVYDGYQTNKEKEQKAKMELSMARSSQLQLATMMFVNSEAATSSFTPDQMVKISVLYDEWSDKSVHYKVDKVVNYESNLYRCETEHDSQPGWEPDKSPSLWSKVNVASDGADVWTQPTGAHNAYNIGDKVHYPRSDSPVYVSTIDGNVWSPDAYPTGWKLDGGSGGSEEPDEPGGETYPKWVQPTGAHDAYQRGDKVSHNGKNWVSDADGNVWEPGVYGWTEE